LFVKVEPEQDVYRWYAVTWGPTLFGTWAVVCAWGRIGTDWSQRQVREFDGEEGAVTEAEALILQRLRRGYTVVE
jgi:predicted DNA-binding WGR domain protein